MEVPPVAKLLIIDPRGQFLMLYRSAHPTLPAGDPDIAGGLIEPSETPETGVIRETFEETELAVPLKELKLLYRGTSFSSRGREYSLFEYQARSRPRVKLSWEHQDYAWLDKAAFIDESSVSADRYMRMVAQFLEQKINA